MLFDAPKLEEWHHLEFSYNTAFMSTAFVINISFSFFCFCHSLLINPKKKDKNKIREENLC